MRALFLYTRTDGTVFSGNWFRGCLQRGEKGLMVGATKEECGFTD